MIVLTVLYTVISHGASESPLFLYFSALVFNMLIVLIPVSFVSMFAFYTYTTRALWVATITAMTEAKEAKAKASEVAAKWLRNTTITQAISVITAMLDDIFFILFIFGQISLHGHILFGCFDAIL